MTSLTCTVSVPGVVYPFGRYSSIFDQPGLACAIDKRFELEVKPSELGFSIVDGYKLEPFKHPIFHEALTKLWPMTDKYPLEFTTKSQFPFTAGLGAQSALVLAITSAIYELRKELRAEQEQNNELKKKHYTKPFLARKAYSFELALNPLTTPLGASTTAAGGIVYSNTVKSNSLWPLLSEKEPNLEQRPGSADKKHQIFYAHKLELKDELKFVIGGLKGLGLNKYSTEQMKPMFDEPLIDKRKIVFDSLKVTDNIKYQINNQDSIPKKLERFKNKSGFAKENIIEMGKLVLTSLESLKNGNLSSIGELMKKNQNLLTILGVYPPELRALAKAAENNSYGVSVTGVEGNTILSLPIDPAAVIEAITEAGGETMIMNISKKGYELK